MNAVDFSARWGWVPVLDFALGLRCAAIELVGGSSVSFEFTESDATIDFAANQGDVIVSATYTGGHARIPTNELRSSAESFLARTITELTANERSLAHNPFVARVARELSSTA